MKNIISKKLIPSAIIASMISMLVLGNVALASEVTGTLTSGLNSSVSGVVIAPPTSSPGGGTYSSPQTVSLTAGGSSSIHYTTDGTDPTCISGISYSTPFTISSTQTIKAISCYPGSLSSPVATYIYIINSPVVAMSGGGSYGGGGGYGGSSYGGGSGVTYYPVSSVYTTTNLGSSDAITTPYSNPFVRTSDISDQGSQVVAQTTSSDATTTTSVNTDSNSYANPLVAAATLSGTSDFTWFWIILILIILAIIGWIIYVNRSEKEE